jgi:hypothetical protein
LVGRIRRLRFISIDPSEVRAPAGGIAHIRCTNVVVFIFSKKLLVKQNFLIFSQFSEGEKNSPLPLKGWSNMFFFSIFLPEFSEVNDFEKQISSLQPPFRAFLRGGGSCVRRHGNEPPLVVRQYLYSSLNCNKKINCGCVAS